MTAFDQPLLQRVRAEVLLHDENRAAVGRESAEPAFEHGVKFGLADLDRRVAPHEVEAKIGIDCVGVAHGLAAGGIPVATAPALGTSAGSWAASAVALGPVAAGGPRGEALTALVALGYRPAEATRMVDAAEEAAGDAPASTEEIIRRALQSAVRAGT